MRVAARGLVVSSLKYGDNRLIVKIYTDLEGMKSFMVRRSTSAGGKVRSSFFFSLSQIEFTYDKKEGEALSYLGNIRLSYVYRNLYSDVRKSGMAFFMAEVLGRCITEPWADTLFFEKLTAALQELDRREDGFADFHLFFLLELTSLMGVYPQEDCEAFKEEPVNALLHHMTEARRQNGADVFWPTLHFNRTQRQQLLKALADYCRVQAGLSGDFNSLGVLQEIYLG